MKKANLNYWVDVGIGVAFVLSAVSGVVMEFAGPGASVLSVGYRWWDQLHLWSSVGMIAGVLAHLLLHWKWIKTMTGKTFAQRKRPQAAVSAAGGNQLSRRQFLSIGFAALASGALAAGLGFVAARRSVAREDDAGERNESAVPPAVGVTQPAAGAVTGGSSQVDASGEQVVQQAGVACPRGIVNDPYPGRCRWYTDENGDGFCDYSAPGSGTNAVRQ